MNDLMKISISFLERKNAFNKNGFFIGKFSIFKEF